MYDVEIYKVFHSTLLRKANRGRFKSCRPSHDTGCQQRKFHHLWITEKSWKNHRQRRLEERRRCIRIIDIQIV
ncbi:unnamed protein product [Acanthoscelides obtectus]|uniref:Uncharacterized protein n=1 Tax=Acanthoscelides obtectus TaxID=200917 RepID=A0A9P0QCT8_ACAOB|nr:unnamed protein product [Acanthoscelides obtectus]CAK1626412.1 hypothetical protein AOBTE_LOCUS3825 [Acanthoscelides obtectus]